MPREERRGELRGEEGGDVGEGERHKKIIQRGIKKLAKEGKNWRTLGALGLLRKINNPARLHKKSFCPHMRWHLGQFEMRHASLACSGKREEAERSAAGAVNSNRNADFSANQPPKRSE